MIFLSIPPPMSSVKFPPSLFATNLVTPSTTTLLNVWSHVCQTFFFWNKTKLLFLICCVTVDLEATEASGCWTALQSRAEALASSLVLPFLAWPHATAKPELCWVFCCPRQGAGPREVMEWVPKQWHLLLLGDGVRGRRGVKKALAFCCRGIALPVLTQWLQPSQASHSTASPSLSPLGEGASLDVTDCASLPICGACSHCAPSPSLLVPSHPGGGSFGGLQQSAAQAVKRPLRQWSGCCHLHSLSLWEMTLYLISFQRRTCDSSCVTSSEITEHFAISIANRASASKYCGLRDTLCRFVWVSVIAAPAHSPQLHLPLLLQSCFVAAQQLPAFILIFWEGGCSSY